MTTLLQTRESGTTLDDIPRLLRREWKYKRPHLQRSTSLPVLAPAPHFHFFLLDRPARPVFTCGQCGFTNTLVDMCLWCCWTSPKAQAAWAHSEEQYKSMKIDTNNRCRALNRKISAPPRVHWHPPPAFKYAHPSRRSEPPPTRSSGIRLDLSTFIGSVKKSVSSRHDKMRGDGGETVAELWGNSGLTSWCALLPPFPSSICTPSVAAKATPNVGPHKCDAALSDSQTVLQPLRHSYCLDDSSSLSTDGNHNSLTSSPRASSVRIVLPPRRPSLVSLQGSSHDLDTASRPRSRAYYTLSRRTILEHSSPEYTSKHIQSRPPSSLGLTSKIPRIRIPSTFTQTPTSSPASTASSPSSPASTTFHIPTTNNMTIVHDYNHDKYTHDNASSNNNILVASSAPISEHFLHSDTHAYVYSESIFKKGKLGSSGLSVACSSFMDLSTDVSVERTLVEDDTSRCLAESPPPEVVVLSVSPVIEGSPQSSDSSISFPTAPLSKRTSTPLAKTATSVFNEASDPPRQNVPTKAKVSPINGRRARERASAPPPTLHGLQFLDLSDDPAAPSVPATHAKSHSISGLPVRARSQVARRREGLHISGSDPTNPNKSMDGASRGGTEAEIVAREWSHTHGRSKSQPTSSVRLGNPRRPYYSAIRPHMGVGASLSQPASPTRPVDDSRPGSRGASSRPGSSAHLTPSYPASRASSPAPSSYIHPHPKTKSFLDIDVLDDEEYLFSSLTPPGSCPPVYAQACATSELHIHRTGMSFTGLGLGLGSGVFGNPEAAIGPRPTSSLGFRESRDTSRGDLEGSIRDVPRFATTTRRLGRDKFSLSRVWRRKGAEPVSMWATFSSRMENGDVDENGVRRHPRRSFAPDLGRIKDIGKDVGKMGVEGVAESIKKVGRGLKGLKSLVNRRAQY